MKWIENYNLILASGSPRRKELLEKSGFSIIVRKIEIEEDYPENINMDSVAEFLAEKKLVHSIRNMDLKPNDIVITADTIVIKDEELLGKPKSKENAKAILKSLSNSSHKVITGVCFGNEGFKTCFSSVSIVYFDKIDQKEIEYYVNNFEVLDKAGAYGIQDWIGICKIKSIKGSYPNIMGFPTHLFCKKLKEFMI